ncbi:MAG: hypothetical protein ACOX5K_02955 [Bacteroidales bacterium]
MKKRIYFFVLCAILAFAINACSDSCKTCVQTTYDSSGGIVNQGTPAEYCGVELIGIEATPDFKLGDNVTKWECY